MTGAATAGSGRVYRLDPHSLPVRGTMGPNRQTAFSVEQEQVTLLFPIDGGARKVVIPVETYDGIAVRIEPNSDPVRLLVELSHSDPNLSIPLAIGDEPEDIAGDWQTWSRLLDLPMLVVMPDGTVSRYAPDADAEDEFLYAPRRRGAHIGDRRPRFLAKRRAGDPDNLIRVNFREIIART